jgi:hypothetical protein
MILEFLKNISCLIIFLVVASGDNILSISIQTLQNKVLTQQKG